MTTVKERLITFKNSLITAKSDLATAITAKGVTASGSDSFDDFATKISSISTITPSWLNNVKKILKPYAYYDLQTATTVTNISKPKKAKLTASSNSANCLLGINGSTVKIINTETYEVQTISPSLGTLLEAVELYDKDYIGIVSTQGIGFYRKSTSTLVIDNRTIKTIVGDSNFVPVTIEKSDLASKKGLYVGGYSTNEASRLYYCPIFTETNTATAELVTTGLNGTQNPISKIFVSGNLVIVFAKRWDNSSVYTVATSTDYGVSFSTYSYYNASIFTSKISNGTFVLHPNINKYLLSISTHVWKSTSYPNAASGWSYLGQLSGNLISAIWDINAQISVLLDNLNNIYTYNWSTNTLKKTIDASTLFTQNANNCLIAFDSMNYETFLCHSGGFLMPKEIQLPDIT
jgi:hypothetical protein